MKITGWWNLSICQKPSQLSHAIPWSLWKRALGWRKRKDAIRCSSTCIILYKQMYKDEITDQPEMPGYCAGGPLTIDLKFCEQSIRALHDEPTYTMSTVHQSFWSILSRFSVGDGLKWLLPAMRHSLIACHYTQSSFQVLVGCSPQLRDNNTSDHLRSQLRRFEYRNPSLHKRVLAEG